MAYIDEEKIQKKEDKSSHVEKSFLGYYIDENVIQNSQKKVSQEQGNVNKEVSQEQNKKIENVKNLKVNEKGIKKTKKSVIVKLSSVLLVVGISLSTLAINNAMTANYNTASLNTFHVPMEELINESSTCLDEMIALYPEQYENFVKLNNALIMNESLDGLPLERKVGNEYEPTIYEFEDIDLEHVAELYELYFEYKGTNETAFIQICQRLLDYKVSIEKYANEQGMIVVNEMAEIVFAAKVADTMNFDYTLMSNFEIISGMAGSRLTFDYNGKPYTTKVIDNEGKYLLRQLMNNLVDGELRMTLSQVKYAASDTTELSTRRK